LRARRKQNQLIKTKEAVECRDMLPDIVFVSKDFALNMGRTDSLLVLSKQTHQQILKHCCQLKPKGVTIMNKQDLCEEIMKMFDEANWLQAFNCCIHHHSFLFCKVITMRHESTSTACDQSIHLLGVHCPSYMKRLLIRVLLPFSDETVMTGARAAIDV